MLATRSACARSARGPRIVAGGRLYNNEQLQSQITFMTNHAYQIFQQAGYDHDDIYYLSADPVPPAYVDAPSLTATLQYAITTWAPGHLLDGDPLYIYLGDHGQRELFYLDTGSQVATTAPSSRPGCWPSKTSAPIVRWC